jgi:hypothetical protein
MVLAKWEGRGRSDGELSYEVIQFLRRKLGLGCASASFGAEKVHNCTRAAYIHVHQMPLVSFRRVLQTIYAHRQTWRLVGAERQLKSGLSGPSERQYHHRPA